MIILSKTRNYSTKMRNYSTFDMKTFTLVKLWCEILIFISFIFCTMNGSIIKTFRCSIITYEKKKGKGNVLKYCEIEFMTTRSLQFPELFGCKPFHQQLFLQRKLFFQMKDFLQVFWFAILTTKSYFNPRRLIFGDVQKGLFECSDSRILSSSLLIRNLDYEGLLQS